MNFRTVFIATVVILFALVVGRIAFLPTAPTAHAPPGETPDAPAIDLPPAAEPHAADLPAPAVEAEPEAEPTMRADRDGSVESDGVARPGPERPARAVVEGIMRRFSESTTASAGDGQQPPRMTPRDWAEAFSKEARDPAWASLTERLITESIGRAAFANTYNVTALECRSNLCVVSATIDVYVFASQQDTPQGHWTGMMHRVRNDVRDEIPLSSKADLFSRGPEGLLIAPGALGYLRIGAGRGARGTRAGCGIGRPRGRRVSGKPRWPMTEAR